MNPGIDFPTITVIQTYFVFIYFLLLLLEDWYKAFKTLTCYFSVCVTKQRLSAEFNINMIASICMTEGTI